MTEAEKQNQEGQKEPCSDEPEVEIIEDCEENQEDAAEQQINETNDALAEAESRYLRLLADFENYKRRTQKERKDVETYAALGFIEELLPILDSFELAMSNQPEENACEGFIAGMVQIEKQLFAALEKAGLTRIPAQGELYDPHLHEAVMTVNDDEVADDTIVDVLRTGYQFKKRVIRPTVCRVAKNS